MSLTKTILEQLEVQSLKIERFRELAARLFAFGILIRDEDGVLIGADTVQLTGRGHTAFALPDRFVATRNRRGTVEFTSSTTQITGLGLRFNPGGAFTSFPVLAQ